MVKSKRITRKITRGDSASRSFRSYKFTRTMLFCLHVPFRSFTHEVDNLFDIIWQGNHQFLTLVNRLPCHTQRFVDVGRPVELNNFYKQYSEVEVLSSTRMEKQDPILLRPEFLVRFSPHTLHTVESRKYKRPKSNLFPQRYAPFPPTQM